MSRRTATNHQDASPKRVRFDATAREPPIGETRQVTPKSLADSLIHRHVESLQPQFATILAKLGLSHIDLLHKLYNKQLQVSRMESSEEFVPRSARIEFMFHMSKAANERPEFLALKEETDNRMVEFQKFLTGQIIKATKIECETLAIQLREGFVKALRIGVEGFLVGDGSLQLGNHNDCDAIISALMETRSARLLCHTTFSDYESFCITYKQLHNVSVFPIPQQNVTTASSLPSQRSHFFHSTAPNTAAPVPAPNPVYNNLDSISRIIESIFISPFDEYLAQCKRNKIALELKRLSTSRFTEESTAQTQMELDREPSLDRSQLQDLVRKHAQAENKSLVKEIEKLRQQIKKLESKNIERGQHILGASSQKEMKTSPRKTNQNNSQKQQKLTQKAGEANKDTRKKSKKQKTSKENKNTGGNGKSSRTKRNK
jgi:hypothetical protein